jgi:hypothetical protein
VFLHLKVDRASARERVTILRNGVGIMAFQAQSDTTVVDTLVQQATTYQYNASLSSDDGSVAFGTPVFSRTLEPTSHNITWENWNLGTRNVSFLSDVAIMNDTLAFAVGEIYLDDTTGQNNPILHNLAVWNGHTWDIRRHMYLYHGQPFLFQVNTVFCVDSGNAWLGGNGLQHWDGSSFTEVEIPEDVWGPYRILGIWGAGDLVYVVGEGGHIASYDGSTWRRIESNTQTAILDVWSPKKWLVGDIFCLVNDPFASNESSVLRVSSASSSVTTTWTTTSNLYSLWTNNGFKVYSGGDGLFSGSQGSMMPIDIESHSSISRVRGLGENDIFVVGVYGLLAHFNGLNWFLYGDAPNAHFSSVALSETTIIAVGQSGSHAFAAVGRRRAK